MEQAEILPVTSVHDALSRAIELEKTKVNMVNTTFKTDPTHKEIAESICKQHGTNLSVFLRYCVEGLIRDFAGPKQASALGIEPSLMDT